MSANEQWYIQAGASRFGPLTSHEVLQLISTRDVPLTSLVWQPGMSSWQPLKEHFAATPKQPLKVMPLQSREPLPHLFAEKKEMKKRERSGGVAAAASLTFMLSAILLTFTLFNFREFFPDFNSVESFTTTYVSISVAAIGTGAIAVFLGRQFSKLPSREHTTLGRLAKAVSVLTAIGIIALSVVFSAVFEESRAVLVASQKFSDYSVTYDAKSRALNVVGSIGLSLDSVVEAQIREHPEILWLRLDSMGGLVDVAFSIADVVTSSGVGVYVAETCASACVIIYSAGKQRWADLNANFGFHRSSAVVDSDFVQSAIKPIDAEVEAYLLDNGVPQDIVEKSRAYNGQSLLIVDAIELAEKGYVQQLMDGEYPVDLDEGRWRWILYKSGPPDSAMQKFVSAAAKLDKSLIARFGPSLYAAMRQQDETAVKQAFAGLSNEVISPSIRAGSDSAIVSYLRVSIAMLETLRTHREWEACVGFAEGSDEFTTTRFSGQGVEENVAALANLVESAVLNEGRLGRTADGEKLIARTIERVGLQEWGKDKRLMCEYYVRVFNEMIGQGPRQAAAIMRWSHSQK